MKTELTTTQLPPAIQSLAVTIRNEIEAGKERAYLAMEQEKRLTYWNVGKHIKEHLLKNRLVEHQINIILFTELFIIRFGYDLGGFPNYSHNI